MAWGEGQRLLLTMAALLSANVRLPLQKSNSCSRAAGSTGTDPQ